MTSQNLNGRYLGLVRTLQAVLENSNPSNIDHCRLVARYADAMATRLRLSEARREALATAAELHTLGVHLQLEARRQHAGLAVCGGAAPAQVGALQREARLLEDVLGGVDGLKDAVPIITERHEWFEDGGEQISLEGRILAVADAFVDLATPKSHREPVDIEDALRRLEEGAGRQFDPPLVALLASVVRAEEDGWGVTARVRRLNAARCHYWLSQGHFQRQRRDPDRALQCYNQAADLAERMHDPVYMQQACLGMGLIYLEQDQGDAARDVLERGRLCLGGTQGSARLWHALLAALCTWHQGQREDSWRMLELVIRTCREERESSCLALATGLSANLMLAWRGPDHPDFSSALDAFVEVVERHDVLDEVIRLRAQALPLLAEAIRQGVRAATARAIMTRLGEPLHDSFKPAAEAPRRTSVPMVAVSAPRVAEPEAQPLRVECFGNCTVAFGGRTIRTEDWPVQKAMRLFAMLVHKPEGVYDSALLGHFWPESDEERARASLRNALYYVRGILDDLGRDAGPGTVPEVHRSRRSRAISLRGDYWVDTVALESGVARAGDLFALERHEEARNALGVLSLYRGAFMEGVDDDWVQGPRTHYAEVYLKGMHLLARCHLAMGDAEAAEAVARRALVHDDLRETLHVALLEALLAQGRRAEAMRHYQDAAAHFEKEFGISVPRILTDLFPRLVA